MNSEKSLKKTFILASCLKKSIIVFTLAFSLFGFSKPSLIIYSPSEGAMISNNMPNLTWSRTKCESCEIWIDGKKMDKVQGYRNSYTPIGLSYGNHEWQVIAVSKGGKTKSLKTHFTINDKPLETLTDNAILLREGWKVQSSAVLKTGGKELSSKMINTKKWYSTSLPSTVLTTLVRNGVYSNPNVALNNMLIPDCNDEFNAENDLLKYSHIKGQNPWTKKYWYRKEFTITAGQLKQNVWLNIGEINYRAEAWLNGVLLADTSEMVGMERSFRFNITDKLRLDKPNILAIAIYPPDHPGKPAPSPITPLADPGCNMADGMISKDYTKWDALGWDWQPDVRDRDMGITEDVYLSTTGDLELSDNYVTSDLPLPDTTNADLTISTNLTNHSAEEKQGTVTAKVIIDNEEIAIEKTFKIAPNSTSEIIFKPADFNALQLENPQLWWPFGYGKQNLYTLKLEAKTVDGLSANSETKFGIREVETYIGTKERVYKINGQEIYMKGGNWVLDMNLNWTASRYDHEIRLTRNAGLNFLRIWGPTGAPPSVFYEAADKYGILIWQDFLNDFWGTFKNTPEYTPNFNLFEKATTDIIKKNRNHPSLIIWCGGNEGPNPKEDLIVNKLLPTYDGRDSKHYLRISNGDGLHGGGPYHTLEPANYFTHDKMNGFSSEIGPSGIPVYESLLKFMNNMGNESMEGRFPLNGEWAYHDATDRPYSDTRKFTSHDNIIRTYYGAPASIGKEGVKEYAEKCQVLNYEVYRSTIEAINCQLWSNASGYALWKSNSSWPSVVWQVYDWYMQAHAGYYATQKANELVHIQLNRATMEVDVLNTLHRSLENCKLHATLFNSKMEALWSENKSLSLAKNSVTKPGWTVPSNNELSFLVLKIEDSAGKEISNNFYWLNRSNDFRGLKKLPQPKLMCTVSNLKATGKSKVKVTLMNYGNSVASFVALKLVGEKSGAELLPSYWNTNYLNILPGQTIEAIVEIDTIDVSEKPTLEVTSYNMKETLRLIIP
jgi:hypothetical protein